MAERTRARRGASGSSTRRRSEAQDDGGKLSRDYSDEEYREPGEGYNGEEPTKGLYTCELVRITDHTSQDGNQSVKWLFRLADGSENKHGDDVSGWMDSQYTTENTAWKEQQMLVALGVIKPGGKVNLTYDGIVKKAKQCTVRVGVERVLDEETNDSSWRGRMQAFLPLRESTGKSSTASGRRARDDEDAEDVFEDDPEGDDEEEETPPPRRSRSRRKPEPEPEPEEDEGEEEVEGEDWPEDPDELAAALEELSLTELKKVAKDDFGVTPKRGEKADAIIDAILDTLDEDEGDQEDEEEEPEEEPEPPKRTRRAAKGASTGTRRKRGSQDPPF